MKSEERVAAPGKKAYSLLSDRFGELSLCDRLMFGRFSLPRIDGGESGVAEEEEGGGGAKLRHRVTPQT